MIIGIPKEIKNSEYRVGLIPNYVYNLTSQGHKVYVQRNAGSHCGFLDDHYEKAGAILLNSLEEVYKESELIIKVKEPQKEEISLIRENQAIFGFFHFPGDKELLLSLKKTKSICIAYETLEINSTTPILAAMSSIAGKLGVLDASRYLYSPNDGKGIVLGGFPGVSKGHVVILGGGFVGYNAATVAYGLGANVTLLEINEEKMCQIKRVYPHINFLFSNKKNIQESISNADLIISGVHIVGSKPPVLISRDMLSMMKENTVLVDVSIDQGGVFETSQPQTLENPTFKLDGIIHYSVPNMPTMASRTASEMLSNVSFPYILKLIETSVLESFKKYKFLEKAVNLYKGSITNENVAKTFNLDYVPLNEFYK